MPDLRKILGAGINCVTITEELADPEAQSPQLAAEIDAIEQYVGEGHSILGTYKVFQHFGAGRMWDNRELATIF